jgi:hypothetical protein
MIILLRGDLFTGLSFLMGIIVSLKFWGYIVEKCLITREGGFEKK